VGDCDPTMKRDELLLNKINVLLRRVNAPKYLNKFGPKKYTLAEKLYALFLRSEWKSSFRRTKKLCDELKISCASKSTMHYTLDKLPWQFIKNMLKATIIRQVSLAAVDETTLSRTRLSEHYMLRAGIDIKRRETTKLSILADTRSKKILAARFRKKIVHDIKDVKYLLKESAVKPSKLVADKAYDAEWFREFLHKQNIAYCIPTKGKVEHGFYRKRDKVDHRVYRRRAMVESSFFRLKQLFGHSVSCITARNMSIEVFLRLILYNISLMLYVI